MHLHQRFLQGGDIEGHARGDPIAIVHSLHIIDLSRMCLHTSFMYHAKRSLYY